MISLKSIAKYFATSFTFSMDGGIGEAAMYGALFGGGKNLISGGNILTGALQGAIVGGAGGALLGPGATAADTGVGLGTEAASQAAVDSQIASAQSMLQPTTEAIGGANLSTTGGMGSMNGVSQGLPNSVTQGQFPNFSTTPVSNVAAEAAAPTVSLPGAQQGIAQTAKPGMITQAKDWWNTLSPMEKAGVGIGGTALLGSLGQQGSVNSLEEDDGGPLKKFKYNPNKFTPTTTVPNVYHSHYAEGGIAALADGGYPMARQDSTQYATPTQMPISNAVVGADYDTPTNPYTGEPQNYADGGKTSTSKAKAPVSIGNLNGSIGNPNGSNGIANLINANASRAKKPEFNAIANFHASTPVQANVYHPSYAAQAPIPTQLQAPIPSAMQGHIYQPHYAEGGIAASSLGGYAAGGSPRLLKGPGDGMSDDIPATIANKQPARLADGEFVVPADVVSHLGNGSTDAGAKHLHSMMDKVRKARTGRKAQGKQINANKFLPK